MHGQQTGASTGAVPVKQNKKQKTETGKREGGREGKTGGIRHLFSFIYPSVCGSGANFLSNPPQNHLCSRGGVV